MPQRINGMQLLGTVVSVGGEGATLGPGKTAWKSSYSD